MYLATQISCLNHFNSFHQLVHSCSHMRENKRKKSELIPTLPIIIQFCKFIPGSEETRDKNKHFHILLKIMQNVMETSEVKQSKLQLTVQLYSTFLYSLSMYINNLLVKYIN